MCGHIFSLCSKTALLRKCLIKKRSANCVASLTKCIVPFTIMSPFILNSFCCSWQKLKSHWRQNKDLLAWLMKLGWCCIRMVRPRHFDFFFVRSVSLFGIPPRHSLTCMLPALPSKQPEAIPPARKCWGDFTLICLGSQALSWNSYCGSEISCGIWPGKES